MCLSERLVHSILKVWLLRLPLSLCFLDSGKQSSPFMRMQRPDKLTHIFVVMTIPILLLDEVGLMRPSHITGPNLRPNHYARVARRWLQKYKKG